MTKPVIHPNWAKPPDGITDGFSIEITAKDIDALADAAPMMPPDTPVAVTFLPGEAMDARVDAAKAVRSLGFEPMPHFSARRIGSPGDLDAMLKRSVDEADVQRAFLIAGDPPEPEGPFTDSSALLETGIFERAGIQAIGIAGHPEGHPAMTEEQCFEILEAKCAEIAARGMAPLIVTQFGFDAEPFLAWLKELRRRGIDDPVRIGVPGPAGIKTLLRFASRCGVGASAAVLGKYGISLGKLIGTAGPDKLVDAFAERLGPEHGPVRLHFYPFGGLANTVRWIDDYSRRDKSRAD